ncbi:MAG: acetolactate synthase small subunit [Thermotogae bacterium]|nr:acetolactate synthase small subunit [Thermotogota bacterium]
MVENGRSVHEHVVSVLVLNKPGVLRKIAGMFARRGFNISSISVGTAVDPSMARLTIVVKGDDRVIEQIEKQLYKVIDVVKVSPILPNNKVEREMALIKVQIGKDKLELLQLVEIFRGKIVDVGKDGVIVEITGATSKVEAFIKLLKESNKIVEIARTGRVALNRWDMKEKVWEG